ncbi:MAG: type II toxin-antitoxin system VapC family toxin [Calditrichaeota bacterium]|nr:MAG: type II toxin-antitoxin system VapC family toxin [Calditrichota bacterium]
MKYLLDTHTFLWVLFDDEKLSQKAKEVIRNLDNDVCVSVVTFWEISLKYAIGKLELQGVAPEDLVEYSKKVSIEILPISPKEASTFYKLPRMKNKDPFDRLIIWQSICQNLTLISKDKKIRDYRSFGLKVIW